MKRTGFISLIILLIAVLILALLFIITNPFSRYRKESVDQVHSTPQRFQETQDVVDTLQKKSIERQSIDVE